MSEEADNQPSTSSGKTGSLTFITRNGGLVLMRAGYQYTKKRENKNGWTHWRCVNVNVKVKECSGSLQIKCSIFQYVFLSENYFAKAILLSSQDGNISNEKNHSCEPDELKNVMAKKLDDLRDKVMKSDFAPIPNIYNKFKSQFCATESDLVRNIPSFANIKSKLYYARNNAAGVKKLMVNQLMK
nr:uncharacterized protein LOC126053954 [Helicoverpa armigera]